MEWDVFALFLLGDNPKLQRFSLAFTLFFLL